MKESTEDKAVQEPLLADDDSSSDESIALSGKQLGTRCPPGEGGGAGLIQTFLLGDGQKHLLAICGKNLTTQLGARGDFQTNSSIVRNRLPTHRLLAEAANPAQ